MGFHSQIAVIRLLSGLVVGIAMISVACAPGTPEPLGIALNHRDLPTLTGDSVAGKTIFYRRESPKCWTCHAIGDERERAGPNLSSIATKLNRDELLDALINPSREILNGYSVEVINTQTLGPVIGVIVRESPTLLVRNEFGEDTAIPVAEVVSRNVAELSMMPDDLTDPLSDQELLDLLEFLGSLR